LGAAKILAVDYDEWSIANTAENLERNNCIKSELKKADNAEGRESFDIILANINKNVILDNFSALVLLLSGLLIDDENDIHAHASKYPLIFNGKATRNNWICLRFSH
jgi:ribosomal protein L11 methyltransferase